MNQLDFELKKGSSYAARLNTSRERIVKTVEHAPHGAPDQMG